MMTYSDYEANLIDPQKRIFTFQPTATGPNPARYMGFKVIF